MNLFKPKTNLLKCRQEKKLILNPRKKNKKPIKRL